MGLQIWIGLLLEMLRNEWNISYIEESFIPISLLSGMFCGSYFWGIISDRYGRMASFKQSLILISIGCIIGAFSDRIWILSLSFIITGFGVGGSFTIDGTVFLEYSSQEKSHYLVALGIFTPIGSALPPALTWLYLSIFSSSNWRLVQGSLGVISLLLAIPRLFIKETPMYTQYKSSARIITIEDNCNQEKNRVLDLYPQISIKQQFFILFKAPLLKYTLLYCIIWSGLSFSYNGINSFLPAILTRATFNDNEEISELMFYQQISIV